MSRKRFTTEQVIHKSVLAEVEIANGKSVPESCNVFEVTEQTYYRRRKQCGGLKLNQTRQFKQLKRENDRLNKWVADRKPYKPYSYPLLEKNDYKIMPTYN